MLVNSTSSFSQDCTIQGKKEWEKVEIRTLEIATTPEGYNYTGEAILMKASAKSIKDLSEKQIKKIKEQTASYKACVVYVDFNNLMGVDYGLYYVWSDEGSFTQP